MFRRSAELYDVIYEAAKDYEAEANKMAEVITSRTSPARTLLDVACGTGLHLAHLRSRFDVQGLDLDPGLLEIARKRLPGVPLHEANMLTFELVERFDVITCLFSAIGYCGPTTQHLNRAIAQMAAHLDPGGLLIVEPWFSPERWEHGHIHATFIDRPDLKVARMNRTDHDPSDPRDSTLEFHYLVCTKEGVEYFTEVHAATLFTVDEYVAAFRAAGLEVEHDPDGPSGRGLYIGRVPPG